ncbi:hypothetical protein HDU90_004016 [Geranomyces variabilis]|nr:hypothetical protein HDU90_004016 [Geranomyces variabilis]
MQIPPQATETKLHKVLVHEALDELFELHANGSLDVYTVSNAELGRFGRPLPVLNKKRKKPALCLDPITDSRCTANSASLCYVRDGIAHTITAGQHVCLNFRTADNPQVVFARVDAIAGTQHVEVGLLIPFSQTELGKCLLQPDRKRHDRVNKKALKEKFLDPGWYFATTTHLSISARVITDKVQVLQDFPASPHEEVIFCTHREGDKEYLAYDGKKHTTPLSTALAVIFNGRIFWVRHTDFENRVLHVQAFKRMTTDLANKCGCDACMRGDLLENEWVLGTRKETLEISEGIAVVDTVMEAEFTGRRPKQFEKFHNGVHPRYIHFFRHKLRKKGGIRRITAEQDKQLKDLFKAFHQQYPIASQPPGLLSLFDGVGIGSKGFENAGFRKERFVENDCLAVMTNLYNSPPGCQVWRGKGDEDELGIYAALSDLCNGVANLPKYASVVGIFHLSSFALIISPPRCFYS